MSKEEKILGKPETMPVVFMFQPTRFRVIPPDRLSEWEELMKNRVGIPAIIGGFPAGGGATGTVSDCPDADDCDADRG
jgi:hypothetical protein